MSKSLVLRILTYVFLWAVGLPVVLALFYGGLIYRDVYGSVERTPSATSSPWVKKMHEGVLKIDREFEGDLGVYIQDLQTQEAYSLNAVQQWYYASVTKIFVLIELYQQRQFGLIDLDHKIKVERKYFRDGAGPTHQESPGRMVSLKTLMKRMMQESDNTATDMVISVLGLENVNQRAQALLAEEKIGPITSMLTVRDKVYGELHPSAKQFTNLDYMMLRRIQLPKQRLQKVSSLLRIPTFLFRAQSLDEAYGRYYSQGWNTGSLEALGKLFQKLHAGEVISPEVSREILDLMAQCRTGRRRIVAGLPSDYRFAHKTGTQHRRVCDTGIVTSPRGKPVSLIVCAKNFNIQSRAEGMMKQMAQALVASGVFEMEAPPEKKRMPLSEETPAQ